MRAHPLICLLAVPALAGAAASPSTGPSTLSVTAYLEQVAQANHTLRSVRAQNRAYGLAEQEPLTAFSPTLDAGYGHSESRNQAQPGSAAGDSETLGNAWNVQLGKLFATGTRVSLGYASSDTLTRIA